jgi:hypothetical protein
MKKNFTARLKSAGVGAPAKWALVICTLIFVLAANARPPSGGSAADLDGQWYHNGASTRIVVAPNGRNIIIVDEFRRSSAGYAADTRNLAIPSLGITGKISKDGRRISWTNGTEWSREPSMPGFNYGGYPVSESDRPYYVHGPGYYVGHTHYVWTPGHWRWYGATRQQVWIHGHYVVR